MKLIKNLGLTSIFIIAICILFVACDKNTDLVNNDVIGVYKGTLTTNLTGKSVSSKTDNAATAEVKMVGDKIQVHCFSEGFDTEVMLDLYEDNDSIMICLTGNDFENMYGHMLGQGHSTGGMMSDIHDNETEWMHHLNDDHQTGDEHFGGFDMIHRTFGYTFKMNDGDFHFQGVKN
jgi:hypothetical protein